MAERTWTPADLWDPELPDLLTPAEVGALIRKRRGQVYDDIRTGVLPSVKIGRALRIPKRDLLRQLGGTGAGGKP